MAQDRFLIGPQSGGMQRNLKPWTIIDQAFQTLQNMYTWRGSLRKRFGSRVMNESGTPIQQEQLTRFRINIGTTAGTTGNFTGTAPGAIFITGSTVPGQMFSIGNTFLTTYQTGTPAATLTTGLATATFNTTTGALVVTGNTENPSTAVYYYPSTPVMGLATYEIITLNDELLIGFDQQFAYSFSYETGWNRITGGGANALWTGNDSQFFWTTNYRGTTADEYILFITNNNPGDAMRYYDGTNFNAFGSAGTTAINAAGDYVVTCLLIVPFKQSLILLNTTENISSANVTYTNRARWSAYLADPTTNPAWRQDPGYSGGFIDIPNKQAIVSCEFVKDRLIVYAESSTWELISTGIPINPFQWQQINTELGAESTNSIIPFDKIALGIGNVGIHACNGLNVERIDEIIPYTVFDISNSNNGPQRVCGIRDYYPELVYWAYNSVEAAGVYNEIYPNRVLVYDYVNGTWAYNDDSITALGNYQYTQDATWESTSATWEQSNVAWTDPVTQDQFKSVICGNQEGWTFIADITRPSNCMSLQITNITLSGNVATFTVINHNLPLAGWIYIQGVQGSGTMSTYFTQNYQILATSNDTFILQIDAVELTGTYTGGGVISRVSEINIWTKQYNFYNEAGVNIATQKVDFLVDSNQEPPVTVPITPGAQVMVDFFIASSDESQITAAQGTGTNVGTNILETTPYALYPLEQTQDRFWHSIYFNAQGENIQMNIYYDNVSQLPYPSVTNADFQINAIIFYGQRTGDFI